MYTYISFSLNFLPILVTTEHWVSSSLCYTVKWSGSESCSVMSDSLQPHGLYSPWNSPRQNTGVGSLSLLQGIFPTQGSNPGLLHCRWIFTSWATREAQEYWSGWPVPSPADLPEPEIELGSLALQVDSLPTELSGKSLAHSLVGMKQASTWWWEVQDGSGTPGGGTRPGASQGFP